MAIDGFVAGGIASGWGEGGGKKRKLCWLNLIEFELSLDKEHAFVALMTNLRSPTLITQANGLINNNITFNSLVAVGKQLQGELFQGAWFVQFQN